MLKLNRNPTFSALKVRQSSIARKGKGARLNLQEMQVKNRFQHLRAQDGESEALVNNQQETIADDVQQEQTPINWPITLISFIFPALGGFLFGYDIGATSGVLLSLQGAASGIEWASSLTSLQQGLIGSLSLAGALTGSICALIFGDKIGRRGELLLASILYGVSAVITGTAQSLGILLAGRAVYGLGIGFAMHAAPAYIAETAPSRVRGLLISLKEAVIVTGILLGYLSSYLFVDAASGWRYMLLLAVPVAGLLAAGMTWLPDTPRWLALADKPQAKVQAALEQLRGMDGSSSLVMKEMQDIQKSKESLSGQEGVGLAGLFKKQYMRPLSIGILLVLFQQITGQPSVLYYAGKIFQDAGFPEASAATAASVLLGLFKLVMTCVAVFTVDSWGRRPLLLLGICLLVASLGGLGLATQALVGVNAVGSPWATVSLVSLLLYVGAYQVSFGPIAWLIVGEVFPLAIRSTAIAMATFTNFFSNFLVTLVLPSLRETFGLGKVYFGFAMIGIVAVVYVATQVPETKGKSLEEIEAMFIGDDDKSSEADQTQV